MALSLHDRRRGRRAPSSGRWLVLTLTLLGCNRGGTSSSADAGPADAGPADAGPADAGPPLPVAYAVCADDGQATAVGGFCDVTERWGVHQRFQAPADRAEDGLKGVLTVADFDGDGRPDVWTSIGASLTPALLLNRGGRFEDVTAAWGVDAMSAEGSAAADLDGDGDQDLIVGGGNSASLTVYRNDGGRFTAHAPDVPLGVAGLVETVVPADLDADGRLDLLVGLYRVNGQCNTPLPGQDCPGGVVALRQSGAMTFAPVPVTLSPRRVQGMRLFDWDDDGQDEVLVSVDFGMFDGANAVLRVDRSGGGLALRDATAGTGFDLPVFGMGVAVLDVDGDGRDEVYVPNIGRDVLFQRTAGRGQDVAAALGADAYGMVVAGSLPQFRALDPDNALEGPIGVFRAAYMDQRSPAFPTTKWVGVVLDYDDDGVDDLFLPAGSAVTDLLPGTERQQSALLRGTGRRMVDATGATGLGQRHDTRAAAAADFDGDGDLDLVTLETSVHGGDGGLRILRNDAATGRSLTVVARGRGGARDGIDALAQVRVGARTAHRRVNGSLSLFGSGPHEAHFGLGAAAEADEVTVRFPSGAVVSREHVPAGRVTIEE